MKKNLLIAVLMTVATTILLGIIYPLVVTALAQVLFHEKANGQLVRKNGDLIGSRLIGQPFVSDKYFHSRPSAAGNGYDAANSSGSFMSGSARGSGCDSPGLLSRTSAGRTD